MAAASSNLDWGRATTVADDELAIVARAGVVTVTGCGGACITAALGAGAAEMDACADAAADAVDTA